MSYHIDFRGTAKHNAIKDRCFQIEYIISSTATATAVILLIDILEKKALSPNSIAWLQEATQ